ncbi:iron-containing alcohol dehydrogenase, partial [Enterococcus faecium]|nr:iron-containing alcohol dehydrogenase [Enterococcus faecium]
MKENFDFLMPSVNFFGSGVIAKIGDRAKMVNMSKVLIVTDKFLEKMENGPVEQTLRSLDQAGVDYVIYNGVEP